MSIRFSEDHELLIGATRDFARAELVDRDRAWDRDEISCCTALDTLYEMGLMSLRIPERFGGLECPMGPYAHIIRELAWASPSVAVTAAVHNMVADILTKFANPQIQTESLGALGQRGNLAAFAISEPNAGSDPGAAQTRATAVDGGWKLTGSKMWVTNGITGRWFIVLARLDGGSGKGELCTFLLDATQDGVSRSVIHGKMGIRASETAEMTLEGAFVPQHRLVGDRGQGLRIALAALDGGRIGIASQAVGIGQACLDHMISYARHREQFGRLIAEYQAIQWMISDSKTELTASQELIDRAAWLKDGGRTYTREASMAKLFASEAATRIADRAVQVHGGTGYVHECRVEQLYRDARITRIYEGTSEIQRIVIGRELARD